VRTLAPRGSRSDNRDMRTLTVPAPAKLNLFLHLTGRRADGYHTLETIFVALDHGDTITLARRDDGAIRRTSDLPGVATEDDLALRAARALQRATGCRDGVDIAIVKRIALGGGLGGGSSDAASVLLALNRLWNVNLERLALMQIGQALGADVPFFVFGQPAFAQGIGEEFRAVSLPPLWIAVVAPSLAVRTAEIFAAPELTRDTPSAKMDVFSEGYGRNDLQAVAIARFPEIAAALAELRKWSPLARMTGSGACVFAPFACEVEARNAFDARPPGMHGFVARTLARHPLAAFA
jgi:4-diphosphocytidyl-2-C-methyl-D-erythritol kinase